MEMSREILRGIFEDDYEVILAENGREAVEYINLNRGKLAAILLDIVMPEMDGFGVLDYMHEQELMMSVPVMIPQVNPGREAMISVFPISYPSPLRYLLSEGVSAIWWTFTIIRTIWKPWWRSRPRKSRKRTGN